MDLAKVKRTRRKHKNSRLGCANCKKRQIKCDESLPICFNCQKRDDACSYLFISPEEFQNLMHKKKTTINSNEDTNNSGIDDINTDINPSEPHTYPSKDFEDYPIHNYEIDMYQYFNRKDDKIEEKIGPTIPLSPEYNQFLLTKYDATDPSSPVNLEQGESQYYEPLPDQPYVKMLVNSGSLLSSKFTTTMNRNNISNAFVLFDTNFPKSIAWKHYQSPIVHGLENTNNSLLNILNEPEKTVSQISTPINNSLLGDEPLTNAKTINKTFGLNRNSEIEFFDPFLDKIMITFQHITKNSITELFRIYQPFDIDAFFESVHRFQVAFISFFSEITRKSTILFIADLIKNVLCKQKAILPLLSDHMRILICGACEQYAVEILTGLTVLIPNKYVVNYDKFTKPQREIMFTAFILLSICTAYHYNSGYRQTMSIEQSKKSIKYIGTFTAGMFSTIVTEHQRESNDQIHTVKTYSKHLVLIQKYLLIPNYTNILLDEIHLKLQELNLNNTENFTEKFWYNTFANISIFLEKHSRSSKNFELNKSLLGYDKSYIIRLVNEWYQIYPYDLPNFTKITEINDDKEKFILINFSFLSLRYLLESIIPGNRSLVRSCFLGSDKVNYDTISELIKVYKLLSNKDHKLHAIYNIRLTTYLSTRIDRYKAVLSKLSVPEISALKDLSIDERCEKLLNDWKFGNVFTEIQKDSFDLKNGTYIDNYNFPEVNDNENKMLSLGNSRKIDFKSDDELINDFEKTNSGLFSQDYDPRTDTINLSELEAALPTISSKSEESIRKMRHVIYANSDSEINATTMRNCWEIESFLGL
jgi:hypothetical protein